MLPTIREHCASQDETVPLFSVVIPAYNRADVIGEAMSSVLAQTCPDFELIVVDDGSTDSTEEAVAAFADQRVRFIRRRNGGASAARNAGAAEARGRYLVFLDSDDTATPAWLATLADALHADQRAVGVRSGALVVDDSGQVRRITPERFDPERAYPYGACLPGTYAVERAAFVALGGFKESLTFSENTELLIRVLMYAAETLRTIAGTDEPLVRIRRRSNRAREYGSAPRKAAEYILARHGEVVGRDRALRQDYLSIIGVDELRRGRRWAAARWFGLAWAVQPRSLRALLRLGGVVAPRSAWEWRLRLGRSQRDGLTPKTVRVCVACPGAGRINRGYEAFALGLVRQLHGDERFTVQLLHGGHVPLDKAKRVWNLRRDAPVTRGLARFLKIPPSALEQISFGMCSTPALLRFRPHVLFVSERVLASTYVKLRRLRPFQCQLVLSNGGGGLPPFRGIDVVHHVTEDHLQRAIAAGEPPAKHVLIPYGFDFPASVGDRASSDQELKEAVGLPPNRPIVLSVGSLDTERKRMHHVIREISLLSNRPHLVMVGQHGCETHRLEELAFSLLGRENVTMREVGPDEVWPYFEAADVFTLASTEEGFGRVYVEALAAGLPCIVHDSATTRFVLDRFGTYVDMNQPGTLAAQLALQLERQPHAAEARARHAYAVSRFSWRVRHDEYTALLLAAARGSR